LTAPLSGDPLIDDAYRIVAIHRANAPTGSVGRDWHMYRIAQGANVITGYRRGEAAAVTADVEKIVAALNERRHGRRGRVDLRPGRPAATAVATPEREET
jgi:hypothetical protein